MKSNIWGGFLEESSLFKPRLNVRLNLFKILLTLQSSFRTAYPQEASSVTLIVWWGSCLGAHCTCLKLCTLSIDLYHILYFSLHLNKSFSILKCIARSWKIIYAQYFKIYYGWIYFSCVIPVWHIKGRLRCNWKKKMQCWVRLTAFKAQILSLFCLWPYASSLNSPNLNFFIFNFFGEK